MFLTSHTTFVIRSPVSGLRSPSPRCFTSNSTNMPANARAWLALQRRTLSRFVDEHVIILRVIHLELSCSVHWVFWDKDTCAELTIFQRWASRHERAAAEPSGHPSKAPFQGTLPSRPMAKKERWDCGSSLLSEDEVSEDGTLGHDHSRLLRITIMSTALM